MLPLTLRTGWATLHGGNLDGHGVRRARGLCTGPRSRPRPAPVTQSSPGRYREGWDDYEADPGVSAMTLDLEGTWSLLGGGYAEIAGRLVGGCIEVLSPLAGTPYGDVAAFGREHADDGIVVFLEACEQDAYSIGRAPARSAARRLVRARHRGPGRPDGGARRRELTQREAVPTRSGPLGLPVVLDVESATCSRSCRWCTAPGAGVVIDGAGAVTSASAVW